MSATLKTKKKFDGLLIYAEDSKGVRYRLVNEDGEECGGIMLDDPNAEIPEGISVSENKVGS